VAHELEIVADPHAVARTAADRLAGWVRAAVADHGSCSLAVSGGKTPGEMFALLAEDDVPWEQLVLFQVDERVAPANDPDRNLSNLRAALGDVPARVVPMPVEDDDLDEAAARYAKELPGRFDVIHLGIGPDGHTASLVPGDPVLEVHARLVALTGGTYQGRRRMTLTYRALALTDRLLWVIAGEDKRTALAKLLAGDRSIPAGRVSAQRSLVIADRAAAGDAQPRVPR
jgi:6-phosphogluconolactonase